MTLKNFLKPPPKNKIEEYIEDIVSGNRFRLERIVSNGQSSPDGFWYDQDHSEWVLVLTGKAGIIFEGSEEIVEMNPGDYILISAHRRHRVAWTDPTRETVWLAVHFE